MANNSIIPASTTTHSACHTGNFPFYKLEGGGTLFCGGWSKDATYDSNTVVFDLTGTRDHRSLIHPAYGRVKLTFPKFIPTTAYEWVPLEIKDYGLPSGMTPAVWNALYKDVLTILKGGQNVLFACTGGHGRTGMVMSILGYKLFDGKDGWEDPVKKLRSVYCKNAVDTETQHNYVYMTLGLTLKANPDEYKKTYTTGTWSPQNFRPCAYPECKERTWYSDTYGFCYKHQQECKAKLNQMAAEKGVAAVTLRLETPDGKCLCGRKSKKCHGVVMGSCGHVVHDQRDTKGTICDHCFATANAKAKQASLPEVKSNGGSEVVWDYNEYYKNHHGE